MSFGPYDFLFRVSATMSVLGAVAFFFVAIQLHRLRPGIRVGLLAAVCFAPGLAALAITGNPAAPSLTLPSISFGLIAAQIYLHLNKPKS